MTTPAFILNDAERNIGIGNCAVLAYQAATDLPYTTCLDFAKRELKYAPYKGTPAYTLVNPIKMNANGYSADIKSGFDHETCKYPTLAAFVDAHPQGRYMVLVTGHAVCVKDGQLIDNGYRIDRKDTKNFGGRRRVNYIIKLTAHRPEPTRSNKPGTQLTLDF